ncbi:ImmA/IrrE family metallo-endopeptidase [Liquorilactobacillus hordei]|uniref:ImmA/IrrE family metallo-endopeptidase n=1 Tax=Liquorilactobacillus hordei TaxID=468911 RepID=UPI001CBC784D|nr:ImmA/IrrE family metallo-endopeptidase [Liquorilactobacillus hordei]MBZ2406661.1 hypothetical protein [Liquorilactobacillus hordei]
MPINKEFSKKAKIEYAEKKKQEYEKLQKEMLGKIKQTTNDPAKTLEMIKFMNNFHQYSSHNRDMIFAQREGALAVGSFKYFKSEGYHIKKGEKAIKVLVPKKITLFRRNENGKESIQSLSTATASEKKQIAEGKIKTFNRTSFKLGSVFDVTQTDMPKEKYPEYYPNRHNDFKIDDPEKAKELKETLKQVAKDFNIETGQSSLTQNAKGMYMPQQNVIMLNPANTEGGNVAVMIHELAHAALHSSKETAFSKKFGIDVKEFKDEPRAIKELQAEMVAYSVSSQFGIDTTEFSKKYIADWTDNGKKLSDLDPKQQKKIIDSISKVSSGFDDVLVKTGSKQKEQKTKAKDRTQNITKAKEKTRDVGRSL